MSYEEQIIELSHYIHNNPELGNEEYKAMEAISRLLSEYGFSVEKGVGGLATAFKAVCGEGDVSVGLLAEYDALPEVGHACGHNIIAAVAAGAAIQLSKISSGRIVLIGTPAEETAGGKITLMENGIFDDVDFCMMVHPSSENLILRGGTALVDVDISFEGEKAHSSSPEDGINALKALIATFNGIDQMSQEFPMGININGIITEGGLVSNIVPDFAMGKFLLRGLRLMDLKLAKEKILKVVSGVEIITGAKANVEIGVPYAERYPNRVMAEVFKDNMESLGEVVEYPEGGRKLGSSDIGNVSLRIPTIHPYIKIGDDLIAHTLDFTDAAISKKSDEMIGKACKSLAMLGKKIHEDKHFRDEIEAEFHRVVPNYKNFEF